MGFLDCCNFQIGTSGNIIAFSRHNSAGSILPNTELDETVRAHVQGVLNTSAGVFPASRDEAELQAGLLCIYQLKRLLTTPSIMIVPESDLEEQSIIEAAKEFVASSIEFDSLQAQHRYADQVRRILPIYFGPEYSSVSGHALSHLRVAGVSTVDAKELAKFVREMNWAHEIAHAASHVEWGENVYNSDRPGEISYKRVALRSTGWEIYEPTPDKNSFRSRYTLLEECACVSHTGNWVAYKGGSEKIVNFRSERPLNLQKEADLRLAEALMYVHVRDVFDSFNGGVPGPDWRQAVSQSNIGAISIDTPKLCWEMEGVPVESSYAIFSAALDILAPEVYPSCPPAFAVQHLRNRLREVQATGQREPVEVALREAFGERGLKFIRDLSVKRRTNRASDNALLFSTFAVAGSLPTAERAIAREMLCGCQDAL